MFGFGGHCKATTLGVVTCNETSSVLICPRQGLTRAAALTRSAARARQTHYATLQNYEFLIFLIFLCRSLKPVH
jgi:hypothetical protein